MTFVLTHEYSDKSGFTICGVTATYAVAAAWYNANDENNVYAVTLEENAVHWMKGHKSWREERKIL